MNNSRISRNKVKLKSVFLAVVGDIDQISSERYFVSVTLIVAAIFLLGLCVVHLLMGLKLTPVILAGSSSIVMLGLYFLVRFGNCLFIPKLVLSFVGLIMLDLTWYSKYLSNGPVLFFILIFAALVMWVWEGKSLAILLICYYLNIAVLFLIDYYSPEYLFRYPDPKIRSLDIFLSFSLYSSLLIFLLYIVKKEFIRQKEKAARSDRLKSAFLANMSHEIRTPMNAIVGFSHLLDNGVKPDKMQQYINIIRKSSDNLLRLIDDIIDLSKIEAGDLELKHSAFSIRELFIELKEYCSIELLKREKADVKINYFLPDENIFIESDSLRIKQILSNLLNNSIKFTLKGNITFGCEINNRELLFTVSDTGTGIPEEDQKKIFDRFIKYDYLGLNNEGSGIGLSIVEKLVTLLNGKIRVKSVTGKGSSFFFTIPYFHSSAHTMPEKKEQNTNISPVSGTRVPILLVEDDRTSYLLLNEFLSPFNIEIHHITDGHDAIEFIKNHHDIRLILMDIKLPFMNGFEVTKEIRQINQKIPIIAQTGYAMLGDKEKAISAGCTDYITKPLDLKKLQELIRTYVLS